MSFLYAENEVVAGGREKYFVSTPADSVPRPGNAIKREHVYYGRRAGGKK